MKNHTRRPRAYYETLHQRRLDERLTFANLSAESGVPVATLQYWSRRFKAEQAAEHPAPSDDTDAFVRIAVADSSDGAAVEVVLRGNVRIRVRAGFDEHTVLRLVQLLGC